MKNCKRFAEEGVYQNQASANNEVLGFKFWSFCDDFAMPQKMLWRSHLSIAPKTENQSFQNV